MAPPRKTYPTGICQECGKSFEYRKIIKSGRRAGNSSGVRMNQRFCSVGCANKDRDPKIWLDKHGYPQATINGRSMAMHRHVMEKMLGRKLLPTETVHHKDGDRKNYSESNLELWASRHGRGQRVSDLIPAWKLGAAYLAGVLASKAKSPLSH
jgi:hypothetical protein